MYGRFNRLILIILTAALIILTTSCDQPDNVIAPVSTTKITLEPERLPAAPEGMYYHIWVIDTSLMAYSVGSFIWDDLDYRFLDLDSNVIDSLWTLHYDILDPFYRFISVSVEQLNNPPSGSVLPRSEIGPVMLQDTIYSVDDRLMKMVFPVDMWEGYGFFAIETPSDGSSTSNDLSGLWFAEYIYDSMAFADTTDVSLTINNTQARDLLIDVHALDTLYFGCSQWHSRFPWICQDTGEITKEEYVADSIQAIRGDDTVFAFWTGLDTTDADTSVVICSTDECDTLPVDTLAYTTDSLDVNYIRVITDSSYMLPDTLVLDTFVHTYVEFDYVAPLVNTGTTTRYDTVMIYSDYDEATDTWLTEQQRVYAVLPFTSYDHDLHFVYDETFIKVDKFIPSFDDSPNLADPNNAYFPEYDKRWHYKGWAQSPALTPASSFASLSRPCWNPFHLSSEITTPNAPMISTGTFKRFDRADDGNPYTDNRRVPKVPGEDFLLNLPAGVSSIAFTGGVGNVLVTLEPDNFTSDETNFPLILYVGDMPSEYEATLTEEHTQRTLSFDVNNWSSGLSGMGAGFPIIHVKYISE